MSDLDFPTQIRLEHNYLQEISAEAFSLFLFSIQRPSIVVMFVQQL